MAARVKRREVSATCRHDVGRSSLLFDLARPFEQSAEALMLGSGMDAPYWLAAGSCRAIKRELCGVKGTEFVAPSIFQREWAS